MGRARLAVVGALAALGLAACGGDKGDTTSLPAPDESGVAHVYSSLPLHGASALRAKAMVAGMKLALREAKGRAGKTQVVYTSLDDTDPKTGAWDPRQTASNARKVAQDTKAVAYLGDADSAATAISLPVLNAVGVAVVNPFSGYVGLTQDSPGARAGEPQKYQPASRQTFVRLPPRDSLQATAIASALDQEGCTSVAVAGDIGLDGVGLTKLAPDAIRKSGVAVGSVTTLDRFDTLSLDSYANAIEAEGDDCFLYLGPVGQHALDVVREVARSVPRIALFGSNQLCTEAFTDPSLGGLPVSVGRRFACVARTPDLRQTPAGQQFLAAYQAATGDDAPDPAAIYGYEAMRLTLAAIGRAGPDRAGVVGQLFATKGHASALGRYDVQASGDTTLKGFGLYRVGEKGRPLFTRAIEVAGG
jgi:branched-chain amino acid transport system substrate-binding protein